MFVYIWLEGTEGYTPYAIPAKMASYEDLSNIFKYFRSLSKNDRDRYLEKTQV